MTEVTFDKPLGTRWLAVYTILLGLSGLSSIVEPFVNTPRYPIGYAVGWLVGLGLIGLAVGLWQRRLLAWRVNQVLLAVSLVVPAVLLLLGILLGIVLLIGLVVGGKPYTFGLGYQELLLIALIGLGSVPTYLNYIYFRKRRHLFT